MSLLRSLARGAAARSALRLGFGARAPRGGLTDAAASVSWRDQAVRATHVAAFQGTHARLNPYDDDGDYGGRSRSFGGGGQGTPYRARRRSEEPSTRLYVNNIPWSLSSQALQEALAEQVGGIVDAFIVLDTDGRSRGFGFVNFNSVDEATAALETIDDLNVQGRNLHAEFARPQRDRNATRTSPRGASDSYRPRPRFEDGDGGSDGGGGRYDLDDDEDDLDALIDGPRRGGGGRGGRASYGGARSGGAGSASRKDTFVDDDDDDGDIEEDDFGKLERDLDYGQGDDESEPATKAEKKEKKRGKGAVKSVDGEYQERAADLVESDPFSGVEDKNETKKAKSKQSGSEDAKDAKVEKASASLDGGGSEASDGGDAMDDVKASTKKSATKKK